MRYWYCTATNGVSYALTWDDGGFPLGDMIRHANRSHAKRRRLVGVTWWTEIDQKQYDDFVKAHKEIGHRLETRDLGKGKSKLKEDDDLKPFTVVKGGKHEDDDDDPEPV